MDSQFNFSETEKLTPARAIYINMKSHLFQLLLLLLLLVDTTHSANLRAFTSFYKVGEILSRQIKHELKDYAWNKLVEEVKNQFTPPQPAYNQFPPPQVPYDSLSQAPYDSPPQPAYDSPSQAPYDSPPQPAYNHQFPPPQASSQPRYGIPMENLSQIKKYFYNFGYLQNQNPGQFNDSWDEETESAIKTYQQKFNLDVTGVLDKDTSQQIILPRCDVPDINFSYSFYEDAAWPKAGNQWFRNPKNLTYGFHPKSEIPDNMTEVFRHAFMRWSQATSVMNFKETKYNDSNIKIGFYDLNGSDLDTVDRDTVVGGSVIRLQQPDDVNITTGVMYLDANKYWVLPSADNFKWSWKYGEIDLETVAMHQIGHLLGLDHSFEKDSVMYPIMPTTQDRKVEITDSDNQKIQKLYADSGYAASGCFALFGSGSGPLTILFLGFAFMALLD